MLTFMLPLLAVIVYGTVAVIVLIRRRQQFKSGRQTVTDPVYLERAARGTTVPQMFSFVLTLTLLVIAFLLLIVGLGSGLIPTINYGGELVGFVIFGSLFLLLPLTPLTIIVNCFWIYSDRIMYGEAISRSSLVKIQRVTAWIAWAIFLAAGWVILLSTGYSALESASQMNDLIGY